MATMMPMVIQLSRLAATPCSKVDNSSSSSNSSALKTEIKAVQEHKLARRTTFYPILPTTMIVRKMADIAKNCSKKTQRRLYVPVATAWEPRNCF